MSIQAVAWALEQDLPASAKLVLVAICNHADREEGYCWLRGDTIGREASCTARQVYRVAGALARNGFLRKEVRRGKDGKQRANDYWVLFDRQPAKWSWFDKDLNPQDVVGQETETETPSDHYSLGPCEYEPPGPSDSGVTSRATYESPGNNDEPSYEPSKPKDLRKDSIGIGKEERRTYRDAIQSLGAAPVLEPGDMPGMTFVIEGTRWWAAFIAYRKRVGRPVNQITRGIGKYRGKTGRYVATELLHEILKQPSTADPKPVTHMTEDDEKYLQEVGLR